MGQTVTRTFEGDLVVLRLSRPHGNAINGELVSDLIAAAREAESDPAVRGALLSASGKLFCPGLDLQELTELDRAAMERFLERFSECLLALYTIEKPLVAALHGHAVAGGCVLSLCADWRVLCLGARVGLNELKVGLPLPFGVALLLGAAVHGTRLDEVALFGRNYEGQAAVEAGLVHEVHAASGFEEHCLARLADLASKDGRAFAVTKRYLRSATVERFRAHDARLQGEFLDVWFSPETRARLRGIADELRSR